MSLDAEYLKELLKNYYVKIGKEVREQTIKTYMSRVSIIFRLFAESEYQDYKFLQDVKRTTKILENKYKSLSSINTSISAILVFLQANGIAPDDKTILEYRKYLLSKTLKKQEIKKDELSTPKKLKINQNKINKIGRRMINKISKINLKNKLTTDERDTIQDFIIYHLYADQPPVRLDYRIMLKVKKYNSGLSKDYNYYDLSKQNFIFRNYKSVKHNGEVVVPVSLKLKTILKKYMKYVGNDEYLLIDFKNGNPFSQQAMSKKISKIFDGAGVSALRKTYLSTKYQLIFQLEKDLMEDARRMMNSTKIQRENYIQLQRDQVVKAFKIQIKN